LRGTISHPEASKPAFDLISQIVTVDDGKAVTGDNIHGIITILDDFATLAGLATEEKQQQQRRIGAPLNLSVLVSLSQPGSLIKPNLQ